VAISVRSGSSPSPITHDCCSSCPTNSGQLGCWIAVDPCVPNAASGAPKASNAQMRARCVAPAPAQPPTEHRAVVSGHRGAHRAADVADRRVDRVSNDASGISACATGAARRGRSARPHDSAVDAAASEVFGCSGMGSPWRAGGDQPPAA